MKNIRHSYFWTNIFTMRFLLLLAITLAAATAKDLVHGDCADVYNTESTNCESGCGSCFNPNGRSSNGDYDVVKCPKGTNMGYYCDPEGGSFACMDWTFGSQTLTEQESKFNRRM